MQVKYLYICDQAIIFKLIETLCAFLNSKTHFRYVLENLKILTLQCRKSI